MTAARHPAGARRAIGSLSLSRSRLITAGTADKQELRNNGNSASRGGAEDREDTEHFGQRFQKRGSIDSSRRNRVVSAFRSDSEEIAGRRRMAWRKGNPRGCRRHSVFLDRFRSVARGCDALAVGESGSTRAATPWGQRTRTDQQKRMATERRVVIGNAFSV